MIQATQCKLVAFVLLLVVLSACQREEDKAQPAEPVDQVAAVKEAAQSAPAVPDITPQLDAIIVPRLASLDNIPFIADYRQRLASQRASAQPILPLLDLEDSQAVIAQDIALSDSRFNRFARHSESGEPLRSEVMTVKPALPGDRVGKGSCPATGCYRVDMYNFFFNATTTALIDVANGRLIAVDSIAETQPDLSPRLEALALAITKADASVQKELRKYLPQAGFADLPEDLAPVMVNIKSALKNSLCERSQHLCVAPTYVLGDHALWVIVDLTDMRVVGLRWTQLGESGPPALITERTLENDYVFKRFCYKESALEQQNWAMTYHITSSDGLRLANVTYQGKPVFNNAKLVDWHVSYSRKDGFGYSDAIGCPVFSSAVVVAYDGPEITPIIEAGQTTGFALIQDFRQQTWPAPCNYRYEQRYEFYLDGRFRVAVANHGRGCGDDGTYRPVLRINFGRHHSEQTYQVQQWQQENWSTWQKESWSFQNDQSDYANDRFSHRMITDAGQGYLIEPGRGQFADGGRGDNAYIYATVLHADSDEGERDLVTLGSCCNTDYRQGPEQFMQPAESLLEQELVFWYVPQLRNDAQDGKQYCWADTVIVDGVRQVKTWPCYAGPMFVPIERAQ